jgi:hypothetical protein
MKRMGVTGLAALAAAACCVAATATGTAGAAANPCTTTRAFSAFGDDAAYSLFIGGSVEGTGTPWDPAGGAAATAGNERFYLDGRGDAQSLLLPSGAQAQFHAGCLPQLNPAVRLVAFARSGSGSLRVDLAYQDAANVVHTMNLTTLAAGDYREWAPTPALPFLNTGTSLGKQVKGNVRLILTPSGGDWQVDDLYIDPYKSK